jgi:Nuclease-related domain
LREELHRFKKGLQGERESAHYLDSHFKDSANHSLIHDLRLVVDDEVAQIDHLVFARAGLIYLIETKNYSGNLIVNEHGEWAEKLCRQHRPQDLLALPDFMKPKTTTALTPTAALPSAPVNTDQSLAKKLVCAHCRVKIGFPEGKFCWNNTKRFGGLQYCREHQALFA